MKLDLNKIWTLLPTQEKFLKAISECPINEMRAVAYVGALGSGKSWSLCRATIGLCLSYPGMRILVGRHHSTDLRDTTQVTFFNLINNLEEEIKKQYSEEIRESVPPIGEYHKAVNEFVFQNGSKVLFRPLDEAEVKYKSLDISAVAVDEASEVDIEAIRMIMSRRRVKGYPLLLYVVSNPTGYTHWLYKWFVKEKQDNYQLFRTNTFENKENLPPGYIQELSRRFSLDWIKRYLEGEWGGLTEGVPIFSGHFDSSIHVQQGLFYRGNPIWVGVDFGYGSPAVVWAHPDRSFRCQIVREWAPHEIDTYKLCDGIIKRNGVWFPGASFQYFCGHDGKQRQASSTQTNIEIMTDAGMNPSYRFHHLETAFTVIRNMLKVRDDGTPNLYVDPQAELCLESLLGEYKYESSQDGVSKEKPIKDDIHDPVMDAFRYIAYQNYSLNGEPGSGEPRIRVFGQGKSDATIRKNRYRNKANLRGWIPDELRSIPTSRRGLQSIRGADRGEYDSFSDG